MQKMWHCQAGTCCLLQSYSNLYIFARRNPCAVIKAMSVQVAKLNKVIEIAMKGEAAAE